MGKGLGKKDIIEYCTLIDYLKEKNYKLDNEELDKYKYKYECNIVIVSYTNKKGELDFDTFYLRKSDCRDFKALVDDMPVSADKLVIDMSKVGEVVMQFKNCDYEIDQEGVIIRKNKALNIAGYEVSTSVTFIPIGGIE